MSGNPATPSPTAEVFVSPTEYTVSCIPEGNPRRRYFVLKVVRRGDGGQWAVWDGFEPGQYLDAAGEWGFHDGTADWWPLHRFDLDTALAVAREAAPKVTLGGLTVAEVLAEGTGR